MSFLYSYSLLHQQQSGLGKVISLNLFNFDDGLLGLKAINDGKFVGCLMVDFRQAFDLVGHNPLLQKLRLYKCDENSLSWFTSYSSNRSKKLYHLIMKYVAASP